MSAKTAAIALLLAMLATCAGCNVIGFAAAKALPPPRIPAAYELGEAPTAVVVNVDSAVSGELGPMDAEKVAIGLERALRYRAGAQIATEASAAQVVRVQLGPPSVDSPMGSGYRSGAVAARVRVVRASGQELWPNDGSAGRLVELETPPMRSDNPGEVRAFTLQAIAERIGALFYSREAQPGE